MAQAYDRTMKRLTSLFAPDYVDLALGDTAEYRELVMIEDSDQDKELPSLSRAVRLRFQSLLASSIIYVLTALSLRFGAVPKELAAQLYQVKDAERLEMLFRRAVLAILRNAIRRFDSRLSG
jgi:hypothetical protein